jgi:hypothetical protein
MVQGMASLQKLTAAVDRAWERLKQHPTERNIVTYDRAYEEWRQLGAGRGVGRPPSGDQVLSSTERAREARARQQQSAERWEKIVHSIQQLRGALQSSDTAAVENIARALVKETEMVESPVADLPSRCDHEPDLGGARRLRPRSPCEHTESATCSHSPNVLVVQKRTPLTDEVAQ